MTKKGENHVLIIGSGSQARYVIDIAKSREDLKVIGIADIENKSNVGKKVNGTPILSVVSELLDQYRPNQVQLVLAYGKNKRKKELATSLKEKGFSFISIISPKAHISPDAHLGEGCIVNPGAVVMPNAKIGDHVILHSQCVVEHDNVIGEYANLAPGVVMAGRVQVGEGATLYTGAIVIPDIQIGPWAVVAAGSVVTKNVPSSTMIGGNPARPIPSRLQKV